jgi:tRNA dimethylallyltransferase
VEKPYPKTVIAIAGPTAVGKTKMAIILAQWLHTQVISFDSRQFYAELKIGAAPPSPAELSLVKHHFIGHLSVDEEWSAGQFETAALQKVQQVFKKKNTVVLVGGSGLYLRAFTQGLDEMPNVDPAHRQALNKLYAQEGLKALQTELKQKDPTYYAKVDLQNPQRLIRALELIRGSDKTYTQLRQQKPKKRPFNIIKVGLNLPRAQLYQRINTRVEKMMQAGLLEEVKDLQNKQAKNALNTVGYKELFTFLKGKFSMEEAVQEIQKNSRRYAKRQITWFTKDNDFKWFLPDDIAGVKDFINQQL